MKTEYIHIGLLISFVLVLALWVLQVFFRKIRVLCFCSTVSLIVVVASEVLTYLFPDNNFLFSVAIPVLYPGFEIAAVFIHHPLVAFDNLRPSYIILSFIFAPIFYSVVFLGIVEIISYAKKYFRSKTDRI